MVDDFRLKMLNSIKQTYISCRILLFYCVFIIFESHITHLKTLCLGKSDILYL